MKNIMRRGSYPNMAWLFYALVVALLTLSTQEFAYATYSLGTVASTVVGSFTNLTKLITACSYLAGIGFSIGSIMKFKQHKDNPTQIPVGTPIALLFIGGALLFLPTVLGVTGQTLFGTEASTAGPSGTVFSTS